MRVTAFILALIGGIVAMFTAVTELGVGGLGHVLGGGGTTFVVHLAFLTAAAAVIGIIGSALMWASPKAGAWLCVVAFVAGLIGSSIFWILAGLFLALGALFGFLAHHQNRTRRSNDVPVSSQESNRNA